MHARLLRSAGRASAVQAFCAPPTASALCAAWRRRGLARAAAPAWRVPARALSLPRKKQPVRTVDVFCSRCRAQLYKYRKGGKGSLVKCWVERIADDFTEKECTCPGCDSVFARPAMVRGRPAHKIIGDRVYTR